MINSLCSLTHDHESLHDRPVANGQWTWGHRVDEQLSGWNLWSNRRLSAGPLKRKINEIIIDYSVVFSKLAAT